MQLAVFPLHIWPKLFRYPAKFENAKFLKCGISTKKQIELK